MNTSEFRRLARDTHGDRYDYRESEYVDAKTPVKIICKAHGTFFQRASRHIEGSRCKGCVSSDRIEASRQSFVTKAVAVHGQRYDYSKADYTGCNEPVEIVCKVHGLFFQTPGCHLSGRGCLKCGLSKPRSRKGRPPIPNTEEFLNRAREVHGEEYDYTETEYLDYQTRVKIECRRHGEFIQSPAKHLSGQGCAKCGFERRARKRREKYRATFITRAHEVHGEKYDYSESTYEKAKLPVKIRCLEHGQFEQTPHSHLQGSGCPQCGEIRSRVARKSTTEQFILKARAVHGDTYIYEKCVYKDAHSNVVIICTSHGEFTQSATSHLSGRGCPACGLETNASSLSLKPEEFLIRAAQIHGDKYDYSKAEVINSRIPILIRCPIHGFFEQAPGSHLQGHGCIECAGVSKSSKEQFIQKARAEWGDEYDYSKVIYVQAHEPVIITCSRHGDFSKTPAHHIYGSGREQGGQGCPQCSLEATAERLRSNTEEFVEKARGIHGETYGYSLVDYSAAIDKVKIVCPIHGEFEQVASGHLSGKGCQKCADEIRLFGGPIAELRLSGERISGFLYVVFVFDGDEAFWKIGITRTALSTRFASNTLPYDYETLLLHPMDMFDAYLAEQDILKKLDHLRYIPKKEFAGRTECFFENPLDYDSWLNGLLTT